MDTEHKFLEAKRNYLKLKAEYDKTFERVKEANREVNNLLEQGKISDVEWSERSVDNEFKLGLDDIHRRLFDAEKELIEAGKTLLEGRMTKEQAEQAKDVWKCKLFSIREKVIDVLLRMELTNS